MPALTFPVIVRLDNVPVLVILGCALVVNVPVIRLTSILLATILSTTSRLPAILAPTPVTTTTLALPTALILTLPLATGILTLLLPFARAPTRLPIFAVDVTFNEGTVNMPVTLSKVKPRLAPKLPSSLNCTDVLTPPGEPLPPPPPAAHDKLPVPSVCK